MRIALIDDDFTTNFINKNKLMREIDHCEVFTFANGKEAMDYLSEGNNIDIALLDMNMPVMNGIDFLKNHSQLSDEERIKKIFLFVEQAVDHDFKEKHELYKVLKKPLTKEIIELITSD